MADILLADDEQLLTALWKDALEEAGHAVTVAHTGLQALAHMRDRKFDLLITDLNMPDGGGFILTNEAVGLNDKMPVIVVTGDPAFLSTGILARMPRFGADELIVKPVDTPTLLASVEKALQKKPSKNLIQRLSNLVEEVRKARGQDTLPNPSETPTRS